MITIREINSQDYKAVNQILTEEHIEDYIFHGLVFVLIEGNEYAGVGKIDVEDGYGILKYVVVREKHRGQNYGEALLRALLFKLNTMDIKMVFYRKYDRYLIDKGFKHTKQALGIPYSLSLSIDSFLDNCCSYGDNNEI